MKIFPSLRTSSARAGSLKAARLFSAAVLLAALMACRPASAQELTLVTNPPTRGTFYSLTLLQPPFPFNPFPELAVYSTGTGAYVYDDSQVDYVALRAEQNASLFSVSGFGEGGMQMMSLESPPAPGGGGGGSGGSGGITSAPPYSVAGLKLTIPVLVNTNTYIYTTIFDHNPALVYDIYARTNLNSTDWLFGAAGVAGQTNYYLLHSLYPSNFFLMAASNVDSDGDGMPDNWEAGYGLNPNSAADANQDADGDGFTNWQEFRQGTHPNSAPTFQVFLTSPRNALP